ncbi:MAG: hypothetical protein K1Y02_07865 [Candidatus Hydrogenedentes bacterium]|nr:hypothetical protein [Candidatus Hydrogenedentota bacterium]
MSYSCNSPYRWCDCPGLRRLYLALLLAALLLASTLAFADPLRIAADPEHGRLVGFADPRSGHEFVDLAFKSPLWSVDTLNATVPGFDADTAKTFRAGRSSGDPQTLEWVWSDFGLASAPDLRVVASIALAEDQPMSRWRLRIENATGIPIKAVHFPHIENIAPQPNETLVVPMWMGELTGQPRKAMNGADGTPKRNEWGYPGILSMQCLALYDGEGAGLYVACNDSETRQKRFAVFGNGKGSLGVEIVHLPESGADAARYAMPYDVILGAYQGDWYTAAEMYRAWAIEQPWAKQSRLKLGVTPAWVTDTGIWIWNRGKASGVLEPAVDLSERSQLPVSVLWHWWHGCPYDAGFPEYLPPRDGDEPFMRALSAAQAKGVHAIVYMNQRLWGMTTESWKTQNAERYAVKDAEGHVRPEVYNIFMNVPCASMCMGTAFWRDTYAGIAEKAVRNLGVDGIYMDQACSSLACYDSTHGHPLGGGSYWMNGFRMLQADIRTRCEPSKPVALAGEGCGEAWLPYLDLMLNLQVSTERFMARDLWEPVPFFHAVYHDHAVFFGTYGSLTMPPYDELWPAEFAPAEPLGLLDRKFSRQFMLEQARTFVWGQQPSIANYRPDLCDSRGDEMNFVFKLARMHREMSKYLLRGAYLRPPSFHAPEDELDISRLSIYAGQREHLKESRKTVPVVMASAWRAPDGDVAVAIVSITGQELRVSIPLPEKDYAIPSHADIFANDGTARTLIGYYKGGDYTLDLHLAPREARVIEFNKK